MKQIIPLLLLVLFLIMMIAATGHAQPPFRSDIIITSEFHSEIGKGGERRNNLHKGADLVPVDNDFIVFPVMTGIVSEIGISPIYGKYVIIDHGEDLYSLYGHGETIFYTADVGLYVDHDTPLMEMGNTGYSDRAHLHVEVYRVMNGVKVYLDPELFFND